MQVLSLGWEDPLEKMWQPTPVFLPGKSHGQRSLAGYCPWGSQTVEHNIATKQQRPYSLQRIFLSIIFLPLSLKLV